MMMLSASRQMLLWGPRGLNLLDLRDFRQQQSCDVGALVVHAAADAAGSRVLLLLTQPDAHDGVEASRRVQLWDPQTRELGAVLKDAPPSSYASVSADGQYALLSAADGSVQHWHLADPPSLWQTLKDARSGSAAGVYVEARRAGPAGQQNLSRSETPNRVLTGGSDGRLRLWDLAAGSLLKEGAVLDWTPVTGLMLLTATHQAVIAGANGEVALVDLESFQVLQRTRLGSQVVRVFAGLPNGKAVVLGGGGGELVVWSLDSGQLLLQPQAQLGRVTGAALTLMAPHLHSLGGSTLRSWTLTEEAQSRMPEFDLTSILQRRQRSEGRER